MHLFIRDLLLGSRRIPSRVDFKYAMLRAEFSILLIVVAVFYVVLDYVNGMIEFLPWYGLMILIGFGCIVMNRRGYYRVANLTLLLTINALVFVFADVDHPIGGVFFYFMTVSGAGLILFSKEGNRWLQIFFGLLPVILGVIAFLLDFDLVGFPSRDPEVMKITFVANFIVGLLSVFVVIQFLINRNKESEESLM